MPHWLTDAWFKADTWLNVHVVWGTIVGTLGSVVVVLATLRVMASIVTKLVIRQVFGPAGLQLPAESARQAAQAQEEGSRAIIAHQREMVDEVGRTRALVRQDVQRMLHAVRNNTIPLTFVVETPEERQALEALISRTAPRIVVRPRPAGTRTARTDHDPAVPTAWARILTEDDEEGTPCPATTTIAPPPTPIEEPKTAKKAPKPRAPKTKKG